MSAQHTQEPWSIGEDNDGWYITYIPSDEQHGYGLSESDAERIVACVNACAGMSNDELAEFADGSLKTWIDDAEETLKAVCIAVEDVDYSGRCEKGIYALKQQRDELLAALKDLVSMQDVPDGNCSCHINPPCNDCVNYGGIRESIEYAEKAIAKQEGV